MAFIRFKPISSYFNFNACIHRESLDSEGMKYIDIDNEKVIMAFRSKRDLGIFTDKRVVLIDRKGFRGFRKSIYAIKYDSISSYTLNIHNLESTLEIITNSGHQMTINFLKPISLDAVDVVYQYLTECVIEE